MRTGVNVRLGERSYSVLAGAGLLNELAEILPASLRGKTCALISDTNVSRLHGEPVLAGLKNAGLKPEPITVPAGETSKSLSMIEQVCERMASAGMDREAIIVALGGGVVGDLAGFAAAIFCRGIPFIQMPTTVMAQADSAVGGKTGVNLAAGKNLVGSFHQPMLVVADVETLKTLPGREFREGFAEIIKHGIIRDRALFESLEDFSRDNMAELIRRNIEIKAEIVSADEEERSGERALLNFGHTVGHAIETAAGYGVYLHGEAISIGIAAAARLSRTKAGLPAADQEAILRRLRQFELPTRLPDGIDTAAIMSALERDKKFAAGEIRFVLTSGIGSAFVSREVTREEIRDAIEQIRRPE